MATTSINPTSLVGSPSASASKRFDDLKSEDFFGLLIAQLQNQDPLKPTDNQQLLQQMSMIRQMEQSDSLNKSLEALAGEQRFGATSGLIGQYVVGRLTDSSGNEVTVQGLVLGVTFERDGSAVLQLHNGKQLPANRVSEVTVVDNLPPDLKAQLAAELAQLSGGSTGNGGTGTNTGGSNAPTGDGSPVSGTPGADSSDTSAAKLRIAQEQTSSKLLERLMSGRQSIADALGSLMSKGVEVGI